MGKISDTIRPDPIRKKLGSDRIELKAISDQMQYCQPDLIRKLDPVASKKNKKTLNTRTHKSQFSIHTKTNPIPHHTHTYTDTNYNLHKYTPHYPHAHHTHRPVATSFTSLPSSLNLKSTFNTQLSQ